MDIFSDFGLGRKDKEEEPIKFRYMAPPKKSSAVDAPKKFAKAVGKIVNPTKKKTAKKVAKKKR